MSTGTMAEEAARADRCARTARRSTPMPPA